jgi:hypothetical protein
MESLMLATGIWRKRSTRAAATQRRRFRTWKPAGIFLSSAFGPKIELARDCFVVRDALAEESGELRRRQRGRLDAELLDGGGDLGHGHHGL